MHQKPDSTIDSAALTAWVAYRRLHDLVDTEIARDLEQKCGLSMPEYDVLTALVELESPDMCIRVRGLAAHLDWAHSRLSRQLGRMEQRRLIAREPCERDGRGDDVVLTTEGRDAIRTATPIYHSAVHERFTGLQTPQQLTTLIDIERIIAKRPPA